MLIGVVVLCSYVDFGDDEMVKIVLLYFVDVVMYVVKEIG